MSKTACKSRDSEVEEKAGVAPGDDEDDELQAEFEPPTPPDGGWGWVVMIASFFSNMIVDGVCYTYTIFLYELLECFKSTTSKTALVGSLVPGVYQLVGPIVSALANKFGCRRVTIVGSLIAAVFFVASSFSTSIDMMIVTYGIMGGIGFGLMYLPSIVMVGYYFDKKRALATGVAVCGSGVGTFVLAPVAQSLVNEYGWRGANMIIGALAFNGIVFGLVYRPLAPKRRRPPNSTIIQKIVAQKRQRHLSVDESSMATDDNQVVDAGPPTDDTETAGKNGVGPLADSTRLLSTTTGNDLKMSLSASQRSLNSRKQAMASPFARKDILYTGSVQNTHEFKEAGNMKTYVSSVMKIQPAAGDDVDGGNTSWWAPMYHIIAEMFDFSLFKSPAFDLICAAGILAYCGLFTPFVYVTQKAVRQLGVEASQASLILSVLGVCNTVSRVVTGLVSDCPKVDPLVVHNVAAILAGVSTCFVAVLDSFALLMIYAAVFGVFIAAFITLRSIVAVEILGIQKLTNAFGLMALFQGIACLIGSPLSGAILDATGSYVGPFIVSGCLIALAGIICLPVRRIARWEVERAARKSYNVGEVQATA